MWNELSKNIIKKCILEIDNKPIQIHCFNNDGKVITKHINKEDKSENNDFDIEERDIKLVIDKTNLSREKAIKELQKNDSVYHRLNILETLEL